MLHTSHLSYHDPHGYPRLDNITLEIQRGEFALLVGPPASGKSLLLSIIYGLMQPTSGQVWINTQPMAWRKHRIRWALQRRMGFLQQHPEEDGSASVLQALALPLEILGETPKRIASQCARMLDEIHLTHHMHTPLAQLSASDKQCVALARALIHDPWLVLADEPTGSLDEVKAHHVMDFFYRAHVRGTTILMTTHHPRLAARHLGPVVNLEAGRLAMATLRHAA